DDDRPPQAVDPRTIPTWEFDRVVHSVAHPAPGEFLLEGLLREGHHLLVARFAGEGKYVLVRPPRVQPAAHPPVFGQVVIRGPCANLWVDAENGRAEDDRRVERLLSELDIDRQEVAERLHRVSSDNLEIDLLNAAWQQRFLEEADRVHAIEGLP